MNGRHAGFARHTEPGLQAGWHPLFPSGSHAGREKSVPPNSLWTIPGAMPGKYVQNRCGIAKGGVPCAQAGRALRHGNAPGLRPCCAKAGRCLQNSNS